MRVEITGMDERIIGCRVTEEPSNVYPPLTVSFTVMAGHPAHDALLHVIKQATREIGNKRAELMLAEFTRAPR